MKNKNPFIEIKCLLKSCENILTVKGQKYCCWNCYIKDRIGKKRPEHAKLMKRYFVEGRLNKTNSFLKAQNKELNTLEFKKKVIKNRMSDISISDLSDEEIIKLYNRCNSERQKTMKSLKNRIINFISNPIYKNHSIFINSFLNKLNSYDVDKLSDDDIKKVSKIANSVKTLIAMSNNPLMGNSKFFKRDIKFNLKYNLRGINIITTRSSYESNYIDFFEKECILWDYESVPIPCNIGNYLPDFIFNYNGQNYILEVKGTFYRTSLEEYCELKLNNVLNFCNDNNYKYIFTFKGNPISIQNLIEGSCVEDNIIYYIKRISTKENI